MIKEINVVCAAIIVEGRVLACQRGYGKQAGGWEFPGGKIEENEDPCSALVREINEELKMDIEIIDHFMDIDHNYPEFYLHMSCYICKMNGSQFELKEHSAYKWLSKEELYSVEWLDADKKIIEKLSGVLS